jgi:4-amino-4-deoxy-L-arabinose transferase-like glycosyltransferase
MPESSALEVRRAPRPRLRFRRALFRFAIGTQRWLRDPRGLPHGSPLTNALGQTAALVAALWLLAAGLWEIAAPFGQGRDAISSVVSVAGENMLRWRTALPVPEHALSQPTLENVQLEHPFGVYWISALFSSIFGHHEWVCRLPAVLASALTPPLLYALGRALYGPIAGGLAALTFVMTPLTLVLSQVNGFEVPLLFAALLAGLGQVRLRQTGRRGWTVVALIGIALALNLDWPALPFVLCLLAALFLRLYVFRTPKRDFDAGARLFAWAAVFTAAVLAYYLWLFFDAGRLPEALSPAPALLLGKSGESAALLAERRLLLLSLFTPIVPAFTAVGAPLMLARAVFLKRDIEFVPLALFVLAAVQLSLFRERGTSTAVLPLTFAGFFALAVAVIYASLHSLFARAGRRWLATHPELRFRLGAALAAVFLLVPALLAPDAQSALLTARKTGGRIGSTNAVELQDADKAAAFSFWSKRLVRDAGVVIDANLLPAPWAPWVLRAPVHTRESDWSRDRDRYFAVDARFADSTRLRTVSQASAALVLGPFFLFDRARPVGPAEVLNVVRREPSLFERLFVSTNHSIHELVPDPFHTYEVRDYLAQSPNPPPGLEPKTLEQLRIAHNIAYSRGDIDGAQALRERLSSSLDRRPATEYKDGTQLLGVELRREASDLLSIYFESSGPADQRFVVQSRLEAKARGSLIPIDKRVTEVGVPSFPPRDAWRPSYLYSVVIELLRRPGRERFVGSWIATNADVPLLAESGAREVSLAVLP